MSDTYLGIEIGATKLQAVLGDAAGVIRQRVKGQVQRERGAAGIRAQIEEAVRTLRRDSAWRAVGVGFGGPIDWRTGRVACSFQVGGWNDFDLARWLQDLCAAPVHIDNDSNVAAFAEAIAGAGRGCDPVFYTNSGSGVGGGLVARGRIYHGAVPGECEFGHVRLERNRPDGSPGATVQDRCCGWAVDAKIRDAINKGEDTVMRELVAGAGQPGGEARHLAAALRLGDAVAIRILEETADDLAFGLSHVVHLFHPQTIVLGGGLSLVGEPWRDAVAAALPACLMATFQPGPRVLLSALGEDVVPVGALMLAATVTDP